MVNDEGTPRSDESQSLPKDVILDEGIDLVAECGRFINDRFERARVSEPTSIWQDPQQSNYEGITLSVQDPGGLRQEGLDQFHVENRSGGTRVIEQPKGGNGTEWLWSKTDYEIPERRVVDGVESFFPGAISNVRLRMEAGELHYRKTKRDFSGGREEVEDIWYFGATKKHDMIKTALKEAVTYLSPADHPLRAQAAK